eukprot:4102231-Prymnesium_polylepis.1
MPPPPPGSVFRIAEAEHGKQGVFVLTGERTEQGALGTLLLVDGNKEVQFDYASAHSTRMFKYPVTLEDTPAALLAALVAFRHQRAEQAQVLAIKNKKRPVEAPKKQPVKATKLQPTETPKARPAERPTDAPFPKVKLLLQYPPAASGIREVALQHRSSAAPSSSPTPSPSEQIWPGGGRWQPATHDWGMRSVGAYGCGKCRWRPSGCRGCIAASATYTPPSGAPLRPGEVTLPSMKMHRHCYAHSDGLDEAERR